MVGLALTRDGVPVRHWAFPGNTVDVTTVAQLKGIIAELERFDGKFVIHSNDGTLTAEDLALGYKQHQRAEKASRTVRCSLRMRSALH